VSDGLVDVIGTARGAPAPANEVAVGRSADLLDPDFVDLGAVDAFLAPSERYSYSFAGNAQLIDHALASRAAAARVTGLAVARVGADFPEAWRGDADRPERLTDHDGLVVRLRLGPGTGRSPTAPLPGAEVPLPYRARTPEVKP
jgi:predicted extracellular nuclease